MRIWSLHPEYLDTRGLVALWRESLLAQAVLKGETIGYKNHPQLARFRKRPSPVGCIAEYLRGVFAESQVRGYQFDSTKINRLRDTGALTVTRGQLKYEWRHLMGKVKGRDKEWAAQLESVVRPRSHPLFRVVLGEVEEWERIPNMGQE
jgi:hypothetical protein